MLAVDWTAKLDEFQGDLAKWFTNFVFNNSQQNSHALVNNISEKL